MDSPDQILRAAAEILARRTPLLEPTALAAFVRGFIDRRDLFLRVTRAHGSPLYLIERRVLIDRAEAFCGAFRRELPDFRAYYAMKSNNHPAVARALVEAGLGLDVSSGLELQAALDCGCTDIVFSGPAKTDAELALAVGHSDRVTVLMDSFAELQRLEHVAAAQAVQVRAGVRLTTDERGLWRKFGIPLSALPQLIANAQRCSHVLFRGLQFHTSWNLDPTNHVRFITRLGAALRDLPQEQRRLIEFIDIGGGFWPPQGEWLQDAATAAGRIRQAVTPGGKPSLQHFWLAAAPIEEFARQIGRGISEHIFPCVRARIYAEPGRWVCNDAMHLLLTVVDRKADDIAITDAGTNAIGWERFETDYFPVINLSRPDATEHACYVLGSLCTPHDVWGYSYWGQDLQRGDVLLIPTQGAYTYSLRQQFIKPLPKCVMLEPDGSSRELPPST